jgi:hypothetical protein
MTLNTLRRLAGASCVAAALSACDLGSSVTIRQNLIDLALDFCSDQTPVWFAYQNEGAPFVRLLPDASGTFRFTATNRVALAYVLQNGADYTTEIIGARNTELSEISGTSCQESAGTKQLNGTVAGVGAGQLALVSMLFSSAFLDPNQTSFSLTQLADRPLDLVASRANVTATTQSSDRVVIRRSQNFVTNSTMPEINFTTGSTATAANIASVSGIGTGETALMYNNFFSQLGTSHTLFYTELGGNANVTFPSVPVGLTADGDYHDLFVTATSSTGNSFHGAERYFRTAGDQTLTILGPLSDDPVFTSLSTGPYLRIRAIMEPQGYSSAGSFAFQQQFGTTSTTKVTLMATLGFYLQTLAQPWDLTIPDFSSVEGWQNAWGLQFGTPVEWIATGYIGRTALLLGAAPIDGESVRYAGRQSTANLMQVPSPALIAARRRSVARAP